MKNMVLSRSAITKIAVLATVVPVALTLTAGASNALDSGVPHIVYSGLAYGSTVNLGGGVITSGKTSLVGLCSTSNTAMSSNHAAAANVPGVGTIGAVDTSITASQVGTVQTSTANAHTAATSLLGGMITADAIDATATISYNGTGYHHSGSVTLLNVMVNGQGVPVHPTPDQTISIPGVATVVFNHQAGSVQGQTHSWTTTAVTITVLAGNPLGVAPGRIVISNATATLHAPVFSLASGGAYGTTVTVGGVVTSGRTAVTAINCGGNDGVTHTNTTAGVNVPGVITTGVISSSSTSSDSRSTTNATTQAQTAGVFLAGGAITASAVTATAVATRTGHNPTSYTGSGASFTNLVIAGTPFPSTVPPNTVVNIPFVGSVTINSVTTGPGGVQVYGLVLTLVGGTKVVVSSARAQVTAR